MKCSELGGTCDEELYAESWSEMASIMTEHVFRYHPNTARRMQKQYEEDPPEAWSREYKRNWDAALAV